MMQRRQREAEHRLKTKKYRRRGSTNLAHLYERCSQSKLMSMVANLVGAIGCILGNKHIMSTHARMPLTLTFLGYGFVILYFVVANRLRPGRRPRAQVDVESGERNRAGPSRRQVVTLVLLTATAPSLANARLRVELRSRRGALDAFRGGRARVVVAARDRRGARPSRAREDQTSARSAGRPPDVVESARPPERASEREPRSNPRKLARAQTTLRPRSCSTPSASRSSARC